MPNNDDKGDKGVVVADKPAPGPSDIEAQLRQELSDAKLENKTLAGQFKEIALQRFTPEERKKAEKVLENAQAVADFEAERELVKEQAKEVFIEKLILANSDVKLDKDELFKAKTTTEVELMVARAKVAMLEEKGKGGGEEKKGDGVSGKQDLSKMESDKGSGGGTSGGAGSQLEGKGRDYVASLIGKARAERQGAR